jgi:hypothetical protein
MNAKRLSLACLAVFVVVFGYDFVLHSLILRTDYVVTGFLWRPQDEMQKYFGSLLFGQLLLSIAFCLLYAFLIGDRGTIKRGMIYGVLAGLLLCGPNFITFAVQPMPFDLIIKWTVGRLIQTLLAGLVLGAIYRPAIARTAPAQAMAT